MLLAAVPSGSAQSPGNIYRASGPPVASTTLDPPPLATLSPAMSPMGLPVLPDGSPVPAPSPAPSAALAPLQTYFNGTHMVRGQCYCSPVSSYSHQPLPPASTNSQQMHQGRSTVFSPPHIALEVEQRCTPKEADLMHSIHCHIEECMNIATCRGAGTGLTDLDIQVQDHKCVGRLLWSCSGNAMLTLHYLGLRSRLQDDKRLNR